MVEYEKRVLWVDDEVEKFNSLIEDFNEEGIGIYGVTNAKDALKILRDTPNYYDAIVLDALFHFDSSDSSEIAETRAGLRKFLTIYNDEDKISHIPVFVFSGRVDLNFLNIDAEFKESGIEKVYEKANIESFKTLIHDILNSNVNYLSSRFPELNKAIKNLDFSYDEIETLNNSLLYIYKSENIADGNKLRQILEKLLDELFKAGFIPKEVMDPPYGNEGEKVNVAGCYWFLNNYYHDVNNNKIYYVSKEIKNVDGYKSFMKYIGNIRLVSNGKSHYNRKKKIVVEESEIAKMSIFILQITLSIHWVNELVLLKGKNVFTLDEMWSVEDNNNVYVYKGIVEKDSNNFFHCGEYSISPILLRKIGASEGDEILIKKSDINSYYGTKELYPKFAVNIIKV